MKNENNITSILRKFPAEVIGLLTGVFGPIQVMVLYLIWKEYGMLIFSARGFLEGLWVAVCLPFVFIAAIFSHDDSLPNISDAGLGVVLIASMINAIVYPCVILALRFAGRALFTGPPKSKAPALPTPGFKLRMPWSIVRKWQLFGAAFGGLITLLLHAVLSEAGGDNLIGWLLIIPGLVIFLPPLKVLSLFSEDISIYSIMYINGFTLGKLAFINLVIWAALGTLVGCLIKVFKK